MQRMRDATPSDGVGSSRVNEKPTPERSTALIQRLEARVNELEQVVASLANAAPAPDDDDRTASAGRVMLDVMWKCKKCASLLAYYDEKEDVLRSKDKDRLAYTHLGVGGWQRIICRGCGELNEQRYQSPEDIAAQRQAKAARQPR